MVEQIPGLKGLVARMLLESPSVGVREIWERATVRYPDVRSMTVREFGGRFVLPLKRQISSGPAPRSRPRIEEAPPVAGPPAAAPSGIPLLDAAVAEAREERAPAEAPRSAVSRSRGRAEAAAAASRPRPPDSRPAPREHLRMLFHRLALEIALAQTDEELVDVVARLDRYVDEAMAPAA